MPTKPVSHGMQRYLGGNGDALAAMRDGSRNVGAVRIRQLADRASGAGQLRGQIRALRLPDGPRLVESA